jgi:hypothetical protein
MGTFAKCFTKLEQPHIDKRSPFSRCDRPTFSVEKVALICNPASGGTFSSTAIEIIKWDKKTALAQAKVSHILSLGIPYSKNSFSLLMVSKDSIEAYIR